LRKQVPDCHIQKDRKTAEDSEGYCYWPENQKIDFDLLPTHSLVGKKFMEMQ